MYYEGPEALAVSSKSIRLTLGHLNSVENFKGNGRLAPAKAALAEQPLGSFRREDLPARLGTH